ncbi:hypothetical protein FF1_047198 [Malus domestica]
MQEVINIGFSRISPENLGVPGCGCDRGSRASSARRRASQRRRRGREREGGWWRCCAGIGVDGFGCAWVWVRSGKPSFLYASPCFPETEEREGEFRRVRVQEEREGEFRGGRVRERDRVENSERVRGPRGTREKRER